MPRIVLMIVPKGASIGWNYRRIVHSTPPNNNNYFVETWTWTWLKSSLKTSHIHWVIQFTCRHANNESQEKFCHGNKTIRMLKENDRRLKETHSNDSLAEKLLQKFQKSIWCEESIFVPLLHHLVSDFWRRIEITNQFYSCKWMRYDEMSHWGRLALSLIDCGSFFWLPQNEKRSTNSTADTDISLDFFQLKVMVVGNISFV